MFLLNVKRFVKSPLFVFGTLLYIVILYLIQPTHTAAGIESISNSTLTTQPLSFFYFMVVSYEFFYQVRSCQLEEIVAVSKMGAFREKMYGLALFTLLDAILYLVYLAVSMAGTTSVLRTFNTAWFLMLAKAFFYYHFLNYLFAVLVGMTAALVRSRIKGFCALMVVFAVFSRILYPTLISCAEESEEWTHILDILGIIGRNYFYFCDLLYNYTTEYVNLQRILFWIFLTLAIFLSIVLKGRKKWSSLAFLVAACITFVFYIQPSGERYFFGSWGAAMEEGHYYNMLYENPASEYEGIGRKYKEHDFKIRSYQGTLSPGRVLHASVDVAVDKPELDAYCFTLYHGYGIQRVTDGEGEELGYEQDADHVLVRTNAAHHLDRIHFEYKGYSRRYVATSQAVYLPGHFPYLPHAGWNEYMNEPIGTFWHSATIVKGAMYPVDYDIRMDTGLAVYSNLKKTEGGHYVGNSEGATFLASPFAAEMKLKNGVLYYPVLSAPYIRNAGEQKRKYEEAVDSLGREGEEPLVIFDMNEVMDMDIAWYIARDHMIADSSEMKELYDYYIENGYTIDQTDRTDSEGIGGIR